MVDRYQDRPFPADDDYHRGDDFHASAKGESDPLAELARLIGQTDPFATMGRANQPVQPRVRDQYEPPAVPDDALADDDGVSAGPPPWMQRVARQEAPPQDYPSAVHPLQRYAAAHPAPEPDYHQAPPFADEADQESDPSRYDDALYGQLDSDAQEIPHTQAYSDDPYAYQDDYAEAAEEPVQKRRGGMVTVVVVLALAVLGTGAAFAYRTYVGSPRSGEPPIIRADTGPTKIVPTPADPSTKVPDRLAAGDGTEKIVPREEAPVDVNAQPAPRMVFPPLNQNANPPSVASVTPSGPPPVNAGNGTMPNNEPRRIRTLSVRGDQPDGAAVPATPPQPSAVKPAAAARAAAPRNPPVPAAAANANASTANAPMSLSPQAGQPAPAADARTRVATNTPAQIGPSGGYLVQVSSQKNEADAQASYRVLQGKYPAVLGSRSPVIKRADLGDKGVYYRAMVGPFGSREEALQLCGSLETAGGKCVVQRN
ncbi:MAG: SPOR domain-containing protein [Bradyrhizobium sp.]|nr:SPOR domain-containing protein [Bradyrhizobium sp.]